MLTVSRPAIRETVPPTKIGSLNIEFFSTLDRNCTADGKSDAQWLGKQRRSLQARYGGGYSPSASLEAMGLEPEHFSDAVLDVGNLLVRNFPNPFLEPQLVDRSQ
jgi:hypothetical protein